MPTNPVATLASSGEGTAPTSRTGKFALTSVPNYFGCRLLSTGNQVDAGLSPALSEAGEQVAHLLRRNQGQIRKLVDAQYDSWQLARLSISADHLVNQAA